jgi:hypothetical protein
MNRSKEENGRKTGSKSKKVFKGKIENAGKKKKKKRKEKEKKIKDWAFDQVKAQPIWPKLNC